MTVSEDAKKPPATVNTRALAENFGEQVDPNKPADFTDRIGTLDYYKDRAEDFKLRNPGKEPPDYYMDYGDKYIKRFTNELRPTMSGDGQQWMDQARANLQTAMEDRRKADPAAFAELERDPDKFREFAYGTHAKSYLDAGLSDLPFTDMAKIMNTPDKKDLFFNTDGLSQINTIGQGVINNWMRGAAEAVGPSFEGVDMLGALALGA